MKLNYIIEFVADMDRAVRFYRDALGLSLKFQSPGWSEFSTGETSLSLHPPSEKNPAGSIELGFNVTDLEKFHQQMTAKGVQFSWPQAKQDFGGSCLASDKRCQSVRHSDENRNRLKQWQSVA
jgi:catechol 2,3-dioxygenase-like lactoylglutathione lyase family enzyme